jgi:hypothetical protein
MKTEFDGQAKPINSGSAEALETLSSALLSNVIDTLDRMGIYVPYASFEEEMQKTQKTT